MSKRQINIWDMFKLDGLLTMVSVYPANTPINDSEEKTVDTNMINSISIKAIVKQVSFESLRWKFWGNLPSGSIQIITLPEYYNLFINAERIVWDNNDYYVYYDSAKTFQILKHSDYIVVICERKISS